MGWFAESEQSYKKPSAELFLGSASLGHMEQGTKKPVLDKRTGIGQAL